MNWELLSWVCEDPEHTAQALCKGDFCLQHCSYRAWYPRVDHRGLINPSWMWFQVLNPWKSSELFQLKLPLTRDVLMTRSSSSVWCFCQGWCVFWRMGSRIWVFGEQAGSWALLLFPEGLLDFVFISFSSLWTSVWFIATSHQWEGPGIPALGRWRIHVRDVEPQTHLRVEIVPWGAEIRVGELLKCQAGKIFPFSCKFWVGLTLLSFPAALRSDLITEPQNGFSWKGP